MMDFSDPLSGVNSDLTTIPDENSSGSNEILATTTGQLTYVKQENPISYRFVQMETDTNNRVQIHTTNSIPQYYVIGNVSDYIGGNVEPLKIAPKTSTTIGSSSINSRNAIKIAGSSLLSCAPAIVKKRDDRRRATHNEIERKRRDKINQWIVKLGDIIPTNELSDDGKDDMKNGSSTSDCQSKGGILSRACKYIPMLQDNIQNLTQCLNKSNQIEMENKKLQKINEQLETENNTLKMILKRHGISTTQPSSSISLDTTTIEEPSEILS